MRRYLIIIGVTLLALTLSTCREYPENPYRPDAHFDITLYPHTRDYELNVVGGWKYVTSDIFSNSAGLIIFHAPEIEHEEYAFKAYDRLPPNNPYGCCDNDGNCTRLIVDWPYAIDNCNDIKYSLLDGKISEVDGYDLIQYNTFYDGVTLRIYN